MARSKCSDSGLRPQLEINRSLVPEQAVLSTGRRGKRLSKLSTLNGRHARATWGKLEKSIRRALSSLTKEYGFSVAAGDMQLLDGRLYITHSGLLRLASRRRCCGIETCIQQKASDPAVGRWVFKATVYKRGISNGFVGFGDADPSNVSSVVRGAELRLAETRAVNRALRKAYGIGLCSVEELGAFSGQARTSTIPTPSNGSHSANGSGDTSGNGQPRLRDQLCLLIRQYNLDPNLVKAYAADFCGTEALSGASRELVESFISHISSAAKENRDALVCKLNSYAQPVEARS